MHSTVKTDNYLERTVLHLNVADFAVAVERLSESGLHDRPVIVAPQGAARALVYDMSEEAYRAGIRKHMALDRAQRLCRDARLVPPRPHRYERAMSRAFAPGPALFAPGGKRGGHRAPFLGPHRHQAAFRACLRTWPGACARRPGSAWAWTPSGAWPRTSWWPRPPPGWSSPLGNARCRPDRRRSFLRPLPLYLLPGLERPDLLLFREYNLRRIEQALGWGHEHLVAVFGSRGGHIHGLLRGQRRLAGYAQRAKSPRPCV